MEYEVLINPVLGVLIGLCLRTFGVYFLEKLRLYQDDKDVTFDKKFLIEPLVAFGICAIELVTLLLTRPDIFAQFSQMEFLAAIVFAYAQQDGVRRLVKTFFR